MESILNILIILAVARRGGDPRHGHLEHAQGRRRQPSQKLMRARVIAQAIAIVLLMGALFFFGRGAPPA